MKIVSTLLACLVVLGMAALFAAAEFIHFEEAGYSPLYEETLKGAFSRFKQNDAQVPPGRRAGKSRVIPPADPAQSKGMQAVGQANPVVPPYNQNQAHVPPPQVNTSPEMTQAAEFAQNREYDKALAMYQAHVAKHPNSSVGYHSMGDMLQALNRLDEAIAAYRKALALNAGYTCVYGHIGDILKKQGKQAEADKQYAVLESEYRQKIQQPGAPSDLAKYHLARFYVDHDRHLNEALMLIKAVIQKNPDQVTYYVLLAAAYQKTGAVQETLDTIDKILALKPEYQKVYEPIQTHLKAQQAALKDK